MFNMSSQPGFIGIIPARYGSSRFPGKPLADILGKPMIQHVYEHASKALDMVYVATDDDRIAVAVEKFGGRVAMTSPDHKSGTDRCAEAVRIAEKETGWHFDSVINVQGDEPFIDPAQLELLKSCFNDKKTQIATLVKVVKSAEELFDENRPKVIIDNLSRAIYFSRSTIPFKRGMEKSEWAGNHKYYMHIGIYGFSRKVLPEITSLPQSSLELAESLEQLRWIENGYDITVRITDYEGFGIDTPEDLARLLQSLR
jgi:3-deoxy-manno-octulosonate cytidylyltransferase (CMP-KDO synthetase)